MPISIDEIQLRLSALDTAQVENPYPNSIIKYPLRPASVLMPLVLEDNNWNLLFIRRTSNQYDPHSGQVAFPGGASDTSDKDEYQTAIREAQEEIGIYPRDVLLLGRLKYFITITSYKVTPIVCSIPWPYKLILAVNEVSRAFTIPLNWLANPQNQETHMRNIPMTETSIPVIYYRSYEGEVLWGASARFTIGLLEALFQQKSILNN